MDSTTPQICSEVEYDVVVLGAGSAGVAAAVGAAQAGARTLIVERYGFAGGAATASSVLAYCGLFANRANAELVVGGVASDVLLQMRRLGVSTDPTRLKTTGNWIVTLNPEALKVALDRVLIEAGVSVLYHAALSGIAMADDNVTSLQVSGHFGSTCIRANSFVDASGEGTLCFLANRSRVTSPAKVQPASFPVRIGGIDPDWRLSRDPFRAATAEYNSSAPAVPARENGGVVLRVPGTSEIWWMALDLDTDPCAGEAFSLDEIKSRDAAWRLVDILKTTDSAFRHCYLATSGPQIGVRESRHPETITRITSQHIIQAVLPNDTIGLGGWPMEIHHAPGIQEYISVGGEGYFGVPFSALQIPNLRNVLVAGRLIGADSRAFGSVRVMGTAFATGQAAGIGAALMARSKSSLTIQDLQGELVSQGAIIHSTARTQTRQHFRG
ncbi:FAD-dependent oxidoreductase [Microvirga sp. VF16]|uniref:FAD-dependent oxidoreductase n=1 Tax=Microvirga sp. VF16 TaxID=2807101 RepID=UPI00193E266F|nr:FAD-dependent oxidoreductase [Microvirga sp. VF16]QRM33172.1 FAD-dependent oxidoreductase [Microvirga sp. VF16]